MSAYRTIMYRSTEHDFLTVAVLTRRPTTYLTNMPWLKPPFTVCFCGKTRPSGECGDCGYRSPERRRHLRRWTPPTEDELIDSALQRSLDERP